MNKILAACCIAVFVGLAVSDVRPGKTAAQAGPNHPVAGGHGAPQSVQDFKIEPDPLW